MTAISEASSGSISSVESPRGFSPFEGDSPYSDWRKSGIPEFNFRPLEVDLREVHPSFQSQVRQICLNDYEENNALLDQAVADALRDYIYEDRTGSEAGSLLQMSRQLSQRYLDLYQIYVDYEIQEGIPILSLEAGQLKTHGFTSTEILQMQDSCCQLSEILSPLKKELTEAEFDTFFKILTNSTERKSYSGVSKYATAIRKYESIDQYNLIDRAAFMMFRFGKNSFGKDCSVKDVYDQLEAVAAMRVVSNASPQERLLMEIRHRIGGDGGANTCPYWLGSNPLAYLNIISKGDPDHPEAEFLTQMYFVYANHHFTNAFMSNARFLAYANEWLRRAGKDWEIDTNFVEAMNAREPKWLPPIFRYGENAAVNFVIREHHFDSDFYLKYANPFLKDVMMGRCDLNANFRRELSPRELLIQTGDYQRISAFNTFQRVRYHSGGSTFRIKKPEEIEDSPMGLAARQYLAMIRELRLPTYSSISGTFDMMATMAGFVGVALSKEQLQTLKVGLIVFMVPCRDHSVHEILQSAKSFGIEYEAGPGFERYIYPRGGERFIQLVQAYQKRRGRELPSYYLSAKHANEIQQQVIRQ